MDALVDFLKRYRHNPVKVDPAMKKKLEDRLRTLKTTTLINP